MAIAETQAIPVGERVVQTVVQIIRICEHCMEELELSRRFHQLPQDPSENARLLNLVHQTLHDVKSQASDLKEDFLFGPLVKLLSGKRLTKAEFHFLASVEVLNWSAKLFGLSPATDFEVFDNFCCEISDETFQINPDPLVVRDHKIRAFVPPTKFPEQICISDLRPSQRDFFATHLPDLFARFKP